MNSFYDMERLCQFEFERLGQCRHLWTPEGFELIFTNDDDFRIGMNIVGICAKLHPEVTIITFELMNKHLHITASGEEKEILSLFNSIKKSLMRYTKSLGRCIDWSGFTLSTRVIETLDDLRNVIVYNNRNGYIVRTDCTPFTYPWGAGRYFFNPDAKRLAIKESVKMTVRDIRFSLRSRTADGINDLMAFEGAALPLSFCDIDMGERLFRNPSEYFYRLSKGVEFSQKIAEEIGENLYYTDDELFSVVSKLCRESFGCGSPKLITPSQKIEIAKIMRYDYKASAKQIQRMLKLRPEVTQSLGL